MILNYYHWIFLDEHSSQIIWNLDKIKAFNNTNNRFLSYDFRLDKCALFLINIHDLCGHLGHKCYINTVIHFREDQLISEV